DKVLDFCDETADWPEESRFRYVAEQAWSVLHYLEHRPAEKTQRLVRLKFLGGMRDNSPPDVRLSRSQSRPRRSA
ncbi:MAG: hypothetical protein ABR915_25585, partial [Thermoguttaceae bacterium]